MARPVAEPASSLHGQQGAASRRPPPSYSAMASESSLGPRSQQLASVLAPSQQPAGGGGGNERTPLLNSIGAAAESLMNNSVVVGSMQQGVSWRMAAFLLVNSALGAGMLNYPFAYNQIGGVLAAALMQVVLLIFISSTMFILVYCADFNQDNTYHDVLLSMCGKRAQQISALSILFTCYGINVTFLVIIGDQYDRIFNSLLTYQQLDELWFLERKFTIFITAVLFIWPMCYAQRLDFLRYASVLGMFSMLYVAFLTVYEHFALDQAGSDQQQAVGNELAAAITATNSSAPAQSAASSYRWWFEPLAIVPVLCFAYQTHEVIVPVYACMRQRHMASFMKASFFGLLILFFLYNLVGAFGYLTFGARVGADIMSLYDGKDPVVVVGIVALVVKFITTYPPLMFCGRSALDGLYAELRQLSALEFKQNERARRLAISTIWFLSTVALAVFAPDISVTLQLLGSMASINVFVFPGMCLLSLTRRLRRARHALLMGEPPAGASGQRAKDYHLISGSYFGHAMRRRQQLQSSLRNQLISGASGQQQQQRVIGQPAGCYRAGHQPCCDNHQVNHSNHHHHHHHHHNGHNNRQLEQPTTFGSAPTNRHFTATFASLMEFEKNLAHNSTSSEPAAKLNGAARQQLASAPSPLSASSSNLLLSSAENSTEFLANAKPALQNGYASTNGAPQASQRAHQDQHLASATRARLRQQHFERMLAAREPRDQQAACDCATPARSINDSQHDCSDCDDETAPLAKRQLKLDCSHRQLVQQQQQVLSSLSSSFRQLVGVSQKLQADERAQLWASDKKSGPPLAPLSSLQQNQCMQSSTDLNHHEQSINNSLLNKFSSSIAPSTVAQIGISRCAALGLYSFAGLLITFGTFIFIIELVNVLGVLN